MAAREPGGAFAAAAGEAFDPAGAFEEGTPLQYTFMLDLTTGTIGGHCQGNEPGHHAPYLYNVANRPWRTAETIDAINELYTASEIPGNDDAGQTSAWFAWSALGLYPVDPCGDRLHLGKPLFVRADVDVRALDGARALTILGDGCRDRGAHVQSVWFEGARVAAHEVAWADVANGGVLRFVCGAPVRPRWRPRRAAALQRPPPAAARRSRRAARRPRPSPPEEEVSALRGIFALYDPDGTGEIGSNDLENLFKKIGFFNYAAVELIKQFDVEEPKTIDFAKFLEMVKAGQPDQPGEEPDRKLPDGGEQSAPEDGSSSSDAGWV
ncbi:glycosyl hydrolase family 92 protein [Aureococcus anophagefferens]|uniref:Glycosyl hydrolase family 92 protein n=1 Tax=Aureococcus anophagefferens TaxID=44056 RepID=A0ABR1GAH9_AURAN